MKENRIPFDIKYRSDIEAGRYRVETRDGRPARIVCWDANKEVKELRRPLLVEIKSMHNVSFYANGRLWDYAECNQDLFLVPVEGLLPPEDEANERELIAGRDYVPVDWVETLNDYGKWKIVPVEQDACTITGWVARDSKAKGALGCWLVLTERGEWNGETYPIVEVRAVKVDGVTILPDTFYTLKGGEVVACE